MKKLLVFISFILICSSLFGGVNDVFVINGTSRTVTKFKYNTETNEVFDIVLNAAQTGLYPYQLFYDSDLARILCVNSGDNNVSVLSSGDLSEIGTINVGDGRNPWFIAKYENKYYITNWIYGTLSIVDSESFEVIEEVNIGAGPTGILVCNYYIYVTCTGNYPDYNGSQLVKFDPESRQIEAVLETSKNSQNLIEVNGKLHIVCTGDYSSEFGKVEIVNPETMELEASVDIGGTPWIMHKRDDLVYLNDGFTNMYSYDWNTYEAVNAYDTSIPITAFRFTFDSSGLLYACDPKDLTTVPGELNIYNEEFELLNSVELQIGGGDVLVIESSTSVEDEPLSIYSEIRCFPNPFNPVLNIEFTAERESQAVISIYNVRGELVRVIDQGIVSEGKHCIQWRGREQDGRSVESGIYFAELRLDGEKVSVKKICLIK